MNLNIQPINFNIQNVRFKSNPISNLSNNQNLERSPEKDSFEMSVGYVNDTHGQVNNMMRILSGIKGDLKLAGGDIDIGDEKNEAIHYATTKFLNIADIKATVLGNHEIDMNQKSCIDAINRFNGDLLAINFDQKPLSEQSEEEIKKFGRADLKSYLKKSTVVEVKGEKIGLIGACPMDMLERLTHPNYYTDCSIEDLDDTIEDIQEEVDRMKTEGINKIILLSHMGHKRDKIAAKKLDGIDVIIGGHTHELIKDIKEGENLLYSKSGEQVIITEAGREGNYFGKLNLTFDKDGVITKAQNNIGETRLFHKNMINQYVFDDILGEPEKVGYVKQAPPPPSNLAEENPHANFVCDIMREKTNSDIALWHHSGVRSFFHEGEIDSRDVKDMAPFFSSSSWCVPSSAMPQPSMTTMRPAERMVDRRWAMMRVVRPWASASKADWMRASVTLSRAEVASSRMRMGGSFRKMRAMETRCFCPPESITPRSPTWVWKPSGMARISS